MYQSPLYKNVHGWLRYHHGKANKCQNPNCKGKSIKYEYALKKGLEHARNINHYMELCKVCHHGWYDVEVYYQAYKNRNYTGENHPRHKISREVVRQIRKDLEVLKQTHIAKKYNVSRGSVYGIKNNLGWYAQI